MVHCPPGITAIQGCMSLCNVTSPLLSFTGEVDFLLPWIWARLVTCFDKKKNMAEGILYEFQGLTLKCFAVSGFSLLEYHAETTRPGCWTILLEYGGKLRSPSWWPDQLQDIWAKPSCISLPSQSFSECRLIKKPSRGTFQLALKTMRHNTLLCIKPLSLEAVCFIPKLTDVMTLIYIFVHEDWGLLA